MPTPGLPIAPAPVIAMLMLACGRGHRDPNRSAAPAHSTEKSAGTIGRYRTSGPRAARAYRHNFDDRAVNVRPAPEIRCQGRNVGTFPKLARFHPSSPGLPSAMVGPPRRATKRTSRWNWAGRRPVNGWINSGREAENTCTGR